MGWNVDKLDRIEPPIQTKNFLSVAAWILTVDPAGILLTISSWSLSEMFLNMVVPPDKTMFS